MESVHSVALIAILHEPLGPGWPKAYILLGPTESTLLYGLIGIQIFRDGLSLKSHAEFAIASS
jgi:hypothetical protein